MSWSGITYVESLNTLKKYLAENILLVYIGREFFGFKKINEEWQLVQY